MVIRTGARAVKAEGFRGGKVMKSLQILGIVAFAASMTGCVPDWASENETGLLMEIASITGVSGGPGIPDGAILLSDVIPVFNDDALLTVNVYRKNPQVAETSALEHVRLESYQVRYFRSDGHNVEGVDVPYRITGPINSVRFHTPTGVNEQEIDVPITVVRHQAKLEPPLVNLVDFLVSDTTDTLLLSGQGIITTVAEITVFARQVTTGEPLTATGRMQVTFANFSNTQ
jgi:hypothetical protein